AAGQRRVVRARELRGVARRALAGQVGDAHGVLGAALLGTVISSASGLAGSEALLLRKRGRRARPGTGRAELRGREVRHSDGTARGTEGTRRDSTASRRLLCNFSGLPSMGRTGRIFFSRSIEAEGAFISWPGSPRNE